MCLLCYYGLLRDKEISLLRVGDIDIDKQTIYVSEQIAKNDHSSYRTIPDCVIHHFRKLDLNHPKHFFLFGEHGKNFDFSPSLHPISPRKIAKYWTEKIRPVFGWSIEISFYSLKSTGITDMANSGIPLPFVQSQADHSNIAITQIYLEKRNAEAHEALKKADTF